MARIAEVAEPRVMLAAPPPNDPGDAKGVTAGDLEPGEWTSQLSASERKDVYRLTLTDPLTRVALRVGDASAPVRWYVQTHDGNGIVDVDHLHADVPTGSRRARILDLPAGTYWFEVAHADQDNPVTTDYTFLYDRRAYGVGGLPGTDMATAGDLAEGLRNSYLKADESQHLYRFTIAERQRVTGELTRVWGDLNLQIMREGSSGDLEAIMWMTSAHDANAKEFVSRELPAGAYYVRVWEADADTGAGYQMRLRLDDPNVRIAGPTRGEAGELGFGVSEYLHLSEARDYWRFQVNETTQVGVSMGDLEANLNFRIEDDGAPLVVEASSTNPDTDSESALLSLTPGTYFVRVYRGRAQAEGTYRLALGLGEDAAAAAAWFGPTIDPSTGPGEVNPDSGDARYALGGPYYLGVTADEAADPKSWQYALDPDAYSPHALVPITTLPFAALGIRNVRTVRVDDGQPVAAAVNGTAELAGQQVVASRSLLDTDTIDWIEFEAISDDGIRSVRVMLRDLPEVPDTDFPVLTDVTEGTAVNLLLTQEDIPGLKARNVPNGLSFGRSNGAYRLTGTPAFGLDLYETIDFYLEFPNGYELDLGSTTLAVYPPELDDSGIDFENRFSHTPAPGDEDLPPDVLVQVGSIATGYGLSNIKIWAVDEVDGQPDYRDALLAEESAAIRFDPETGKVEVDRYYATLVPAEWYEIHYRRQTTAGAFLGGDEVDPNGGNVQYEEDVTQIRFETPKDLQARIDKLERMISAALNDYKRDADKYLRDLGIVSKHAVDKLHQFLTEIDKDNLINVGDNDLTTDTLVNLVQKSSGKKTVIFLALDVIASAVSRMSNLGSTVDPVELKGQIDTDIRAAQQEIESLIGRESDTSTDPTKDEFSRLRYYMNTDPSLLSLRWRLLEQMYVEVKRDYGTVEEHPYFVMERIGYKNYAGNTVTARNMFYGDLLKEYAINYAKAKGGWHFLHGSLSSYVRVGYYWNGFSGTYFGLDLRDVATELNSIEYFGQTGFHQ